MNEYEIIFAKLRQ